MEYEKGDFEEQIGPTEVMDSMEKITAKAEAIVENMDQLWKVGKKIKELNILKERLQVKLTNTVGQWMVG